MQAGQPPRSPPIDTSAADTLPPPAPAWRAYLLPVIVLAAASAYTLALTTRTVSPLIDDVYITLVYAKNLALGKGFVFNHGAPTLGTTTPLWAMLNALATLPFGVDALPRVVLWFSAICGALSPWLLLVGHRLLRLSPGEAAITGVFLAGSFYPNYGGESNLFQLLLLGLLLAAVARRYALAGVLGALLFLTRGEGALAVLLVGFHALYTGEGLRAKLFNGLRLSAGFWMLILPWFAYAWRQFGYLFPATLASKMKQGEDPRWPPFPTGLLPELTGRWSVEWVEGLPGQVCYAVLIAAGLVVLLRRRSALLGLVLWTILYFLAYSALHVPDYSDWYRIPVYWQLLLLYGIGTAVVIGLILHSPRRAVAWGGGALLVVFGGFFLIRHSWTLAVFVNRISDTRTSVYLNAAQWIRENVPPRATLATWEVGYLGYYTDCEFIDQFALVTPEALPYLGNDHTADILRVFQPDYYLLAVWLANDPMQHTVLVNGGYACMARIDADKDAPGGDNVAYVFRRAAPGTLPDPAAAAALGDTPTTASLAAYLGLDATGRAALQKAIMDARFELASVLFSTPQEGGPSPGHYLRGLATGEGLPELPTPEMRASFQRLLDTRHPVGLPVNYAFVRRQGHIKLFYAVARLLEPAQMDRLALLPPGLLGRVDTGTDVLGEAIAPTATPAGRHLVQQLVHTE